MAIKEVLELIGDDVVIKKLENVKKAGEESLAVFNKPLPELKFPETDTKPTEEMAGHVLKLKDALHILRPILQAAGVQIGEFGAFARLASGSVVGLGAALAGAIVVGLAKLEENAARTRGTLADLFGSTDKGEQAFGALEKQAKQFGTTVEGLAPGLESFQQALNNIDRTAQGFRALREEDLPGAQLAKNADAVTEAYSNFLKLLRAGRLDQDQAEKSAKTFFDTMKEGGTVTSAALRNLPVGTLNELKAAFGQAGLTTKQFLALVDTGAISVDNFEKALINFGPQAQQAFDTKAIKSFSEELGRILTALSEGFKSLSGGTGFSDFVIGQLKRIREGIEATITDLQRLRQFETATGSDLIGKAVTSARDFVRDLTTPAKQGFDEAGFIAIADAVEKLPPKFLDANNSLQKLGAAGLIAGTQIAQGIDQASASLQQMRDNAKATGKELQDVVIGATRFTGRLNQIPVFQPQLAGETSADAAKQVKKTFIDNPEFKQGVTIPVKPEIQKDAFEQSLDTLRAIINDKPIEIKPTVPTEAQQSLAQQFSETGNLASANFQQGFDLSAAFSKFQSLYDQIKSLFAQSIPVNFDAQLQGAFGAGFASGGMVRGPGSTTSDSILAWLSNKEFVVNAKAVAHYGPDLFAALNAMRLPPLNFNMGGMARMLGNRFAAGGPVSSAGNRSLTLVLDQKRFTVSGSKGTIDDLEREASLRGLAMIGKAPSWIR